MPCLLLFTMSVCFPFFSQCQRASPSFHNVSVLPLLFTMSVCFPFFSQCKCASPSFHNVSVLPLLFTMSVCFPFFSQCQRASPSFHNVSVLPLLFTMSACFVRGSYAGSKWVCSFIHRVGQNHIYTLYIRYVWQGNHQIYGHIRCVNTILANPIHSCV